MLLKNSNKEAVVIPILQTAGFVYVHCESPRVSPVFLPSPLPFFALGGSSHEKKILGGKNWLCFVTLCLLNLFVRTHFCPTFDSLGTFL